MTLQISEPKLKPDASEKLLHKKSANSTIIFLHILESTRENICFSKSDRNIHFAYIDFRRIIKHPSCSVYSFATTHNDLCDVKRYTAVIWTCQHLTGTITFKKDTKIPCIYFFYRWKVRKGSVQEKIEQCERDLMF